MPEFGHIPGAKALQSPHAHTKATSMKSLVSCAWFVTMVEGLRDPETNLTWAVKYLAGAYRAASGDHKRTMHYYASGYYHAAKRQRHSVPPRLEELTSANAQVK